jgi:hypothetical protein
MGLILNSQLFFCPGNEPFKKEVMKYQGTDSKLSGVLGKLPTAAIKHCSLVRPGSQVNSLGRFYERKNESVLVTARVRVRSRCHETFVARQ